MSLLDALLLDPAPFHVWIALRTDGIKGCGTITDPYDGSTQARFDGAMQETASRYEGQPVAIHIGPGTFETRGYPNEDGWQIKAGMRIIGSGMDATTLKLVDVGAPHGYAIGHDLNHEARADFAEVSELTIDCNLSAPGGYTFHGAVRLMGDHVKVRRVKAVNWGVGSSVGTGCIVFSIVTVDSGADVPELSHSGFEECLAIEPACEAGCGATAFQIGGTGVSSFTREYHGRSPYVRNCFVDGGEVGQQITGIAASWNRGGVVEGNHIYNVNTGITQPGLSSRDLIVRNNFLKNVTTGVSVNGSVEPTLGAGELSHSGAVVTIIGIPTASLSVGDRVLLLTSPEDFTGAYVIQTIEDEETFTVATPITGEIPAEVTAAHLIRSAARAIVEGNMIELAIGESGLTAVTVSDDNGTEYTAVPDYVHGDIIIRNNKVRYVDGEPPDDEDATLIEVQGVKHLIVQNNVLDTIATAPIAAVRCGEETYFDNRTAQGALLAPSGFEDRDFIETLDVPAEDALTMACFHQF